MGNMNIWFTGKGVLWSTHFNVTATREWFYECCRLTHQLMRPREGKSRVRSDAKMEVIEF